MKSYALGMTTVIFLMASGVAAEIRTVGPADDWRGAINRAKPGDEIVLLPGRYAEPLTIRISGTADAPVVVRGSSMEEGRRSILDYSGTTSNVVDIADGTAHVVLRGLHWDATADNVDAIKMRRGHDITIEGCLFVGIGGISISANSGDVHSITVRDNVFRNLEATGLYFGRHDGKGSHATNILIERNLIHRVRSSEVGYGLEIKLNSWAIIRDNTVYDTKGPGIMVYGSDRGDPPSVIEGNYVAGSVNDGAILVGGGPAIVRNNVAMGGRAGGIVAQDYQGRGLMRDVWIVHNTVLENPGPAIRVQRFAEGAGNVIAYNALVPSARGEAMQPALPLGTLLGNVVCATPETCFENAAQAPFDLRPKDRGPLVDAAGSGGEPWRPKEDFLGVRRDGEADVGAFDRAGTPHALTVGGGMPRPPRVGTSNP